MSQLIACPHCRQTLANDASLAGQVVSCPHCSQQLQMPGSPSGTLLPPMPAARGAQGTLSTWQAEQPTSGPIFINAAPRTEKRLAAGGWFSRAFSSTLGIMLAIFAVFATITLLACGGCLFVGSAGTAALGTAADTLAKERKERTETAKKVALPALKKHGITELDEHATFIDMLGERQLIGKGRGADGKIRNVSVEFEVGQFGTTEQWQIQKILIDYEVVFERK